MEALSKSALQAGVTVDISRKLENILGQLGASGKGLHEKATSVQQLLPPKLLSKLRYVASVRNKLSHDDVVLADADFNQFVASARGTLEELGQLGTQPRPQPQPRLAARPMARSAAARSGAGKWLLAGAVLLGLLVYLSSGGKPVAPVASVVTPEPAAALAPAPPLAPAFQQPAPTPAAPVAKTQREARAASAHRPAVATAAHEAPASAAAPAASFETIRDLTKGL